MDLNHLLKLFTFNSLNLIIIINYCNLFPTEYVGVLRNSLKRVCAFQIELEFGSVGF